MTAQHNAFFSAFPIYTLLTYSSVHPTSVSSSDANLLSLFNARMLQRTQLNVSRDYQACEFPFKRDYGMAPRRVPSSAGLPDKWSEEMDRFICFSDAVGDTPIRMVILSLKKRFPELNQVISFHNTRDKLTIPIRSLRSVRLPLSTASTVSIAWRTITSRKEPLSLCNASSPLAIPYRRRIMELTK